jgi:hypothetical protein
MAGSARSRFRCQASTACRSTAALAAETFLRRLDDYARENESREGTFNNLDQVLALHERAGFAIINCVETDLILASVWQQFVAKLAKRRYIVVAEPARNRSGD